MKPHILDIVIALPLIWGIYKGFRKGLIIEVTTLAALLAGIYGAIRFSDSAAILIREQWEIDDRYMPIVAFALTFILIVVLVNIIGKMIEKLVDMVSLGFLNKLGGGLFRALKIALILSVIFTMVTSLDEELQIIPESVKDESVLYGPLSKLAPIVIPAITDNEWAKKLKDKLPESDDLSPDA